MINQIIDAIGKAQQGALYQTIYTGDASGQNEFVCFVKPELTLLNTGLQHAKILDIVMEGIKHFGFGIKSINVLSADYLAKYNIIAQHYGVINSIASNAKAALSQGARDKFASIYGVSVDDANVLGGIEFGNKFPALSPFALDVLWQNTGSQKLAGGTYCAEIKVDGELHYVINGFHSRQLAHFTDAGRSIVVFHLASDINWDNARQNFIGTTNPHTAAAGSLRNTFLLRQAELGIPEVSQGMNGIHLSAGPIEGLVELVRFCSDYSQTGKEKTAKDFAFGQALAATLGNEKTAKILDNCNVLFDGKMQSVFDITEEKNTADALQILQSVEL